MCRILPEKDASGLMTPLSETVRQRSAKQLCRDPGRGLPKSQQPFYGLKWKLKHDYANEQRQPQLMEIFTPRKLTTIKSC